MIDCTAWSSIPQSWLTGRSRMPYPTPHSSPRRVCESIRRTTRGRDPDEALTATPHLRAADTAAGMALIAVGTRSRHPMSAAVFVGVHAIQLGLGRKSPSRGERLRSSLIQVGVGSRSRCDEQSESRDETGWPSSDLEQIRSTMGSDERTGAKRAPKGSTGGIQHLERVVTDFGPLQSASSPPRIGSHAAAASLVGVGRRKPP
jgi:hypothetical protein